MMIKYGIMPIAIVTGPIAYQFLHPWHWLTYGQNATVVMLIVVVFYTVYTRRMMLLAQQTRRGDLYPSLILQHWETKTGTLEFVIMNVGAGPLLNAFRWGACVSQKFVIGNNFLEPPPEAESRFAGSLVPQATLTLHIPISGTETRTLEVVEGTDLVGGRHQFCLLRCLVGPGKDTPQVRMVHPLDFLPFWQRALPKLSEWKARSLRWYKKAH
jgi:hypothetical protein